MKPDISTDVAIIGAGTAGLYALREVRRAQRSFVLIDHGPLGTTCARVGCMPSKVALHLGALWAGRSRFEAAGISGQEALAIDLEKSWARLRQQRDGFAGNAAASARRAAGEFLIEGRARFIEPNVLEVETATGRQLVRANAVVIATGSRPALPGWLAPVAERTITTDQLFELQNLPRSVGILGLGTIGLEMGLALARLGAHVTAADIAPTVAGITDPVLAERAIAQFGQEMTLWLAASTSVSPTESGVLLRAGEREAEVDLLLAALGRRPNVEGLNLAAAGFAVDQRGLPLFDPETLQVGDWPVFIAGDANGHRALMHEAADEGAIAGYNAARDTPTRFRRKVLLAIAFSNPDVVTVGARFEELDPERVLIGSAAGEANGRARILGAESSLLRVYADAQDGRLLGAAIMAVGGEHLGHLLAWAIQRGETAHSLLELPYYHPVLEEIVQSAIQDIARRVERHGNLPFGLVPLA